MKLTIQAVAKMTGLSESTVRQYAWERKLGKQEGRQRVFTLAEAKKLGGSKEGSNKRKKTKKSTTTKRNRKARPKKPTLAVVRNEAQKVELEPPVKEKRSFWAILGVGRKPKAKISLMEVKGKK